MGSVAKKIKKRTNRFNKALASIEKHLELENSKNQEVQIPQPFDLAQTVESELVQTANNNRKEKNKKKAKRRELKNK
jgi:hypothetical protein